MRDARQLYPTGSPCTIKSIPCRHILGSALICFSVCIYDEGPPIVIHKFIQDFMLILVQLAMNRLEVLDSAPSLQDNHMKEDQLIEQ